jgi:signal transduction histidine kinase
METRTSIYHKLILYIFLLGIFVIVAVSLYSFITSRNAIMQRTFDQLTSLRVAKKAQVEQFFTDRVKEVGLFSHQEHSGIIQLNTGKSNLRITFNSPGYFLNDNFKKFFSASGYYNRIIIVNNDNFECYNLDSSQLEPVALNGNEKIALLPLVAKVKAQNSVFPDDFSFLKNDSAIHLYIASPLFKSGGQVIFELKPSAINRIMKNAEKANGLGKTGEVYLVGHDSLIRSESRFFEPSVSHLPVKTASVMTAFRSGEGTMLNKDYRGIMTLSSFSRLEMPGLNWVIIAEIDKKEAMRPVYKLGNEIVFLSIFIALILFVFAYLISHTIADPIIDLKNATVRVRKGELDEVLRIKSQDELGELTESFNLMTSQLKAQQEELKEREFRIYTSFIDGQEDERQRLSRELHDGLGQMIVATKLKTETLVNSVSGINTESISRLRQMFDSLVDEVRSISNNLMPAVLQEFGLNIALKQVCKEIADHSRIRIIFDSHFPGQELDKRIAVYTFRIAQEAINNAVKHSGASEIIVTLIRNEKVLSLTVQDDGTGINLSEPCNQNGRGLNSMCERVKLLNGLIDISKGENNGTIVSVKIPLV